MRYGGRHLIVLVLSFFLLLRDLIQFGPVTSPADFLIP